MKPDKLRAAAAGLLEGDDALFPVIRFEHVDVPERNHVLDFMASATLPSDEWVAGPVPAPPAPIFPDVTTGPDAGEAEALAICCRKGHSILVNDRRAIRYARARGIRAEPAAVTLRRLYPRASAQELFVIYKKMESSVDDVGVYVKGAQFFASGIVAP